VSNLEALLARRARLQARAATEREELAALVQRWETPLVVVDRGLSLVRAVKQSPWLAAGIGVAMAGLAIVRPRSVTGWVVGARAVWQLITWGLDRFGGPASPADGARR
jgi:hypothetical protein